MLSTPAPAPARTVAPHVTRSEAGPRPMWARVAVWLIIVAASVVGVGSTASVAVARFGEPPAVAAAVPVAPVVAPGALCDTDAHCAALQARLDQRAGHVPAVAFGPASDGGTAVSCPDGWEVDGSSVLDARCVPSTDLIDA